MSSKAPTGGAGDVKRTRARVHATKKRPRWQGVHPITGERMSLYAKSRGELAHLVARLERIEFEHRMGLLSAGEASLAVSQVKGLTATERLALPGSDPKSSGPLVQALHLDARNALIAQRAVLEHRGWYRDDGPVFPTKGGAWRPNANTIKPEQLRKLAVDAGIPNAAAWVTHSLRHSFATLELRYGNDARTVQDRIGHASLRQLEQYLHEPERATSAIPLLERAAAPAGEKPETEGGAGKRRARGRPPPAKRRRPRPRA